MPYIQNEISALVFKSFSKLKYRSFRGVYFDCGLNKLNWNEIGKFAKSLFTLTNSPVVLKR